MLERFLVILAVLFASTALGPPESWAGSAAGPSPTPRALRAYLPRMAVEIRRYRVSIERGRTAFDGRLSPSAKLIRLRASRAEFRTIARRIDAVREPAGLKKAHASLLSAVRLVATAFGTFITAQEEYARDPKPGPLLERNTRANGQLEQAEGLQDRWANTLRASARRVRVPIPAWLKEFRS